MARKTSGCTLFVGLVILGFLALTASLAWNSLGFAVAIAGLWLLLLVVGLRRTFARQRLGKTLAFTAAFWFAMSAVFFLELKTDQQDAADRQANFAADIEDNYRRGAALLENGDPAEALKYLELVERVDPEYKDLWELLDLARRQQEAARVEATEEQVQTLLAAAEKLPDTALERLIAVYEELDELRPDNPHYRQQAATHRQRLDERHALAEAELEKQRQTELARRQAEKEARAAENERLAAEHRRRRLAEDSQRQAEKRERAAADLHLRSFEWKIEDGYAQARGRVENVTEWPQEHVEARIRYWSSDGSVAMTDACLLWDEVLLPKRSGTFRCVKKAVDDIVAANVSFASVHGFVLPHYDRTSR